jgi:hypothetical protein
MQVMHEEVNLRLGHGKTRSIVFFVVQEYNCVLNEEKRHEYLWYYVLHAPQQRCCVLISNRTKPRQRNAQRIACNQIDIIDRRGCLTFLGALL